MPVKRPQLNSALIAKVIIYAFIVLVAILFAKANGKMPAPERLKILAYYVPLLISTSLMFTAGINWSLGIIIQKTWLVLASLAQYGWLFYFEFMMKTSGGFTQIEYYKRALYYVPVLIAQLFIDRFLHKSGSIEGWFYKAKIIAGAALIIGCIWNYMSFDVYYTLKEPVK